MLYLASQFVWFLLAAFGLGFAMGWISHDGGKARFGAAPGACWPRSGSPARL